MVSDLVYNDNLFMFYLYSHLITKCGKNLLQNDSDLLLQNGTVITKWNVYYKTRWYTLRGNKILDKR